MEGKSLHFPVLWAFPLKLQAEAIATQFFLLNYVDIQGFMITKYTINE